MENFIVPSYHEGFDKIHFIEQPEQEAKIIVAMMTWVNSL